MKVLLLSQGHEIEDQPDYNASFAKATELLNIPFISYVEKHGGEAFYNEVVRVNNEFKPDLIFFQFFHSANPGDPTDCVRALRAASNKPLVFGSIGDPFDTGPLRFLGRPLPQYTIQLAACADAFFSTSMGSLSDELVRRGARNVVFLPNAFCPMHFPDWDDDCSSDKCNDITMLCSNPSLITRFPLRGYTNTLRRRLVVSRLKRYFGERFTIYGRGWGHNMQASSVPFKEQVNVYKRSRVVLDAPAPIINTDYYSSDRAFFMLGSGTPLVHFYVPRFEKILRPDEHVFFIHKFDYACNVCERALHLTDGERVEHRKRMVAFVKARHMIDHRVDTIISVAEALKNMRSGNVPPEIALRMVRMHHFLPDVDMEDETRYAVRAWGIGHKLRISSNPETRAIK